MAGNAEIDLPASPYRLLNALDEIGIKSTKEIVYQEILNYGSFGYLEPHFDEYTMLEELNTMVEIRICHLGTLRYSRLAAISTMVAR